MKRDDDLIRRMMFEAEAGDDWRLLIPGMRLLNPSPEENAQAYHALLLADAGYFSRVSDSMFRLTNAGHDWLQSVRDDTVWNKTKEASAKVGGVGLQLLGSIAVGFVKAKLVENGVPLG